MKQNRGRSPMLMQKVETKMRFKSLKGELNQIITNNPEIGP
jgi:hypothetical protein